MTAPIRRSALTGMLVTHLVGELDDVEPKVLVGRGAAPIAGGWENGQPGSGKFVPYVTLKTSVARPAANQRDPVGQDNNSWSIGYQLTSFGALDSQVDANADRVRMAWWTFREANPKVQLNGLWWAIDRMAFETLGATAPNNATDPPWWEVTDTVSVWLSRIRG